MQCVVAETQPVHRARTEILDQHILDQHIHFVADAQTEIEAFRPLQVDREATFAAIQS
jgi:hypothetical protein